MNDSQLIADQVQDADEQRTKRLFVGFLSSILGVDQTYTGADSNASGRVDQFQIANPDGTASVLGRSVSNQNTMTSIAGFPPGLILLAGLAYLLMRK